MQLPVSKEQVAFDLLENLQVSFALYEVVQENDAAIDLRMLWANQPYLDVVKLSLEEAVGMLFSQIAPGDISWIPFYGDVGLRKKGTQIVEGYSDYANQFIHVQAYSPAPGQVATVLLVRNRFVQSELVNARIRAERDSHVKSALNRMAVTFLSPENESFDTIMSKGIKPIADILGLDRVAVYRMVEDKPPVIRQVYLWHGKTLPIEDDMGVVPELSSTDPWLDTLLKGECINADVSKIPGTQADFLRKFGCKAIYFVPIFIYGKFWGIITLEDYTNYRYFSDEDFELLNSTAHLCASTVMRREIEQETIRNKEEIEHQNNLLHTVTQISAIMLQSHTGIFEYDLNYSLGIMARAADADRVYIWKNRITEGKLSCSQIYEWSGSAESQKKNELAAGVVYNDIVPGWEEQLSNGFCISGIVRDMNEYEKAALSPQGILSILVVPIIINNDFWGFVGFDDCHKERVFTNKEEAILRSAGQLIANALIRNEETEKARQAEERIKLMLDATPLCCQLWDDNVNIIDCNEAAVKLYGYINKREYIERWPYECMPEYQPDGQRSIEKSKRYIIKTLEEGRCIFDWLHQLPDRTPMPSEVTLVQIKYKDSFIVAEYIRDLRIIKTLEEKAEEVYYDPLTGVHNRRYLNEALNGLIKSLSRTGGSLSLMMIDIDHFKPYNDTYGHIEGDNCLKIVTKVIERCITRETDFITRYGGDEFTVVLPYTNEDGARLIAEKLIENIKNAKVPHCKNNDAEYVTISIGVTTGKVSFIHSGSDYIKKADEMLYISKQNGRNRYTFSSF